MDREEREDYGARVRAAIAFAGIDDATAAETMGFSIRTLARVEDNTRELTLAEAKQLSARTGVPFEFLTGGWDARGLVDEDMRRTLREVGHKLDLVLAMTGTDPEKAEDFGMLVRRELERAMGIQGREVGTPPRAAVRGTRREAARPRERAS